MSMDAAPGRHSNRPKTGGKDGKPSHLRLVYSRDWKPEVPAAGPVPEPEEDGRNWTLVLVVIAAICCGALGVILWAS